MSLVTDYQRFLAETGSEAAAAIFAIHAQQQVAAPAVEPELLTVKQAAERFALSERTLYRMIGDGLSARCRTHFQPPRSRHPASAAALGC